MFFLELIEMDSIQLVLDIQPSVIDFILAQPLDFRWAFFLPLHRQRSQFAQDRAFDIILTLDQLDDGKRV